MKTTPTQPHLCSSKRLTEEVAVSKETLNSWPRSTRHLSSAGMATPLSVALILLRLLPRDSTDPVRAVLIGGRAREQLKLMPGRSQSVQLSLKQAGEVSYQSKRQWMQLDATTFLQGVGKQLECYQRLLITSFHGKKEKR